MPDLDVEDRAAIDDTGSLSDHEATYQPRRGADPVAPVVAPPKVEQPDVTPAPDADVPPDKAAADAALEESRDPNGRFRPRHRAKSQQARAEDVPRIKELTRKLKEAEEQLAAVRQTPAPKVPAPAPLIEGNVYVPPAPPPPVQAPAEKFTFATYDKWIETNPGGSYEDWNDAKYEARDAWKDQQRAAAETRRQTAASQSRDQQIWDERVQAHMTRERAFIVDHPDYLDVKKNLVADSPDPPLLFATVMGSDNSAEVLYHLATHPDQYHEMRIVTDGKPVSEANVASLRRVLSARLLAGTTGAAVTPVPDKRLSRPPTPVRTGPMQTGSQPPNDGSPLADHEAFYHPKRR